MEKHLVVLEIIPHFAVTGKYLFVLFDYRVDDGIIAVKTVETFLKIGCSIMGVGAVKRISAINFGVVKEMVMTWVLTFPGCGLVGFLMTKSVQPNAKGAF